MEEKSRYREVLRFNDEWLIDSLERLDDSSEVRINVAFTGAVLCPTCGRECPRHDTGRKVWVRGTDSYGDPWLSWRVSHGLHVPIMVFTSWKSLGQGRGSNGYASWSWNESTLPPSFVQTWYVR